MGYKGRSKCNGPQAAPSPYALTQTSIPHMVRTTDTTLNILESADNPSYTRDGNLSYTLLRMRGLLKYSGLFY